MHISYYEADAFARFAGNICPARRNGRWRRALGCSPTPSAAAWQWTRSAYLPYPGYRAAEGALGEYNGKFMVSQMVLRGSSLATPEGHERVSYRNFFYPPARWQFSAVAARRIQLKLLEELCYGRSCAQFRVRSRKLTNASALRPMFSPDLSTTPKRVPAKYFYDGAGSLLFERITELPEYYPTRCEMKHIARPRRRYRRSLFRKAARWSNSAAVRARRRASCWRRSRRILRPMCRSIFAAR